MGMQFDLCAGYGVEGVVDEGQFAGLYPYNIFFVPKRLSHC